jgi:alkaline phosphatase
MHKRLRALALSGLLLWQLLSFTTSFAAASPSSRESAAGAQNVILMISDGAGFNAFEAGNAYREGKRRASELEDFEVRIASTTYMKGDYRIVEGRVVPYPVEQGYDPERMWRDFNYVKGDNDYGVFTDSAAAATALLTGEKTYKHAVSLGLDKRPLQTIAEHADRLGKATGVVTSVQLSHATPACMFAHNALRRNYKAIAREMIYRSPADVIMGCGAAFDPENSVSGGTKYVGGQLVWQDITDGDGANGFTLVRSTSGFEALAGKARLPAKVLGIPKATYSLEDRPRGELPSLATMARGALRVLAQDPEGFVLMVEAGTVDWANHDRDLARMVQAQAGFIDAVAAVKSWVDAHSAWDETLLIVTSDHECGMIWGPGSYKDVNGNRCYDPGLDRHRGWNRVAVRGKGRLPGVQYGSAGHTNALVPVLAKGAGAKRLLGLVDGVDERAGRFWGFSGEYVDNTDIFTLMLDALRKGVEQKKAPSPGTWKEGESSFR